MAGPSLMATLGANIAPFVQSLDNAQAQAKKKGEGIGSALGSELNSKLGSLIGAAAIEETIRRTVEYGEKVQDLGNRLGISTTAIQQWDYALKLNGSSLEAASGLFEKLATARDKAMRGKDEQIAAFQKLGVTLEKLKTLRVEDVAAVIAKGFEEGDPQELIGALRTVGGRGAGEMIAAFRNGLAETLGEAPLISPENIAELKRAADSWSELKAEFQSSIAPAVAGITSAALLVIDFARAALAIPIGALMGAIDVFQRSSWIDLIRHPENIVKGAMAGANEGVEAVTDQAARRDAAADERRERLAKPRVTSLEDEGEAKADEKARKAAERELDRAEKEAEREAEASRKRVEASEARAAKDAQDKNAFKPGELQINSLQRSGFVIGALSNAPEVAMLDVQRKSHEQLVKISKGIETIVAGKAAPNLYQ